MPIELNFTVATPENLAAFVGNANHTHVELVGRPRGEIGHQSVTGDWRVLEQDIAVSGTGAFHRTEYRSAFTGEYQVLFVRPSDVAKVAGSDGTDGFGSDDSEPFSRLVFTGGLWLSV